MDRSENSLAYGSLGGLDLELFDGGNNVVYGPSQTVREVARYTYNAANAPAVRDLRLRLPGGSAGAFSESRQYRMFWRFEGPTGAIQTQSRLVTLAIDVASAFEASIARGGRTHTMAFGALNAAETGSVNLRFRATDPFQVSLTSQYNGVMRRVSPCG